MEVHFLALTICLDFNLLLKTSVNYFYNIRYILKFLFAQIIVKSSFSILLNLDYYGKWSFSFDRKVANMKLYFIKMFLVEKASGVRLDYR